jgi:large subunit ribosomal protein L32
MSVPSFRNSKSKVRRRRSHHGVTAQTIATCKKCEAPIRQHTACASCGTYGDRNVGGSKQAVEKVIEKKVVKKTAKKEEKPKAEAK